METYARRVLISSRERDRAAHPDPNNYEITLDDDIENVTSIALVSARVPYPRHLVHAGNADLLVSLDGGRPPLATATLPKGDYSTAVELAAALQDALRAIVSDVVVTALPRLDTLRIVSPSSPDLCLLFGEKRSPSSVLGFGPGPVEARATNGIIQAPFRCKLESEKIVVVRLTYPSADDILSSSSCAANRAFAVLSDVSNVSYVSDEIKIERRWRAPLPRLYKIGLKFVDIDGHPYDFQGQDHVVEFKIGYGKNTKYSQMM